MFIILNVIVMGADVPPPARGNLANQRGIDYTLRLRSRTIPAEETGLDDGAIGKEHVLVQFWDIPTWEEAQEYKTQGLTIQEPLGNAAYFAHISPASQSVELINDPLVKWINILHPEDKFDDDDFTSGGLPLDLYDDTHYLLNVSFYDDTTTPERKLIIESNGGTVLYYLYNNPFVICTMTIDNYSDLSFPEEIISLSNANEKAKTLLNETLKHITSDGRNNNDQTGNFRYSGYPMNSEVNYYGTGIKIAIWEAPDCLFYGDPNLPCSNKNPRWKIVYAPYQFYDGINYVHNLHQFYNGYSDKVLHGPGDDAFGQACHVSAHATHVTGILIGDLNTPYDKNGDNINDEIMRGIAPNAQLFWYSQNLYVSEFDSYATSYHVSNHSWGLPKKSGYDDKCAQVDKLIRRSDFYPNKLTSVMCFSAGNGAKIVDSPEYFTLEGSHSTAKNIITVGAVSIERYSDHDEFSRYEESSMGPTPDGRLKPELVAPGGVWSSAWRYDENDNYFEFKEGTSMAAPMVAGSIALLYEAWFNKISTKRPLSSTLKAFLIHTARDKICSIASDALKRQDTYGPDYKYGYGLIQIDKAIDIILQDAPNQRLFVEGTMNNCGTGVLENIFRIYVPEDQNILQVTLVWDDIEGKDKMGNVLVNDLDLEVYDPMGFTPPYLPWVLDPNNPGIAAMTGVNTRDNIEQVRIEMPPPAMQLIPGYWIIKVKGTKVNSGVLETQYYSLVASYNSYSVGDTPCPVGTGNLEFPDTKKFIIKDSNGKVAAWFGNKGNLVLKGRLFIQQSNITPSPAEKEFIIKREPDQKIVALIKTSSGDLYIKGNRFEHQTDGNFNDFLSNNPSLNYFFIKDTNGKILAFFDSGFDSAKPSPQYSGLHLRGGLFEHSQP